MKVLVLTNMYPPHHLVGYELSCRDVMERFRARGHDVMVLTTTMRLPGVADAPEPDPIPVRRELSFYWSDHRIVKPVVWKRLVLEPRNQDALLRALDDFAPDVVSAWNMGAMSLGLLTRVVESSIPLVLNICDEWPIHAPLIDAWARIFVGRRRFASVDRRSDGDRRSGRASRVPLHQRLDPPKGRDGIGMAAMHLRCRLQRHRPPLLPARGPGPGEMELETRLCRSHRRAKRRPCCDRCAWVPPRPISDRPCLASSDGRWRTRRPT